MSFISNRQKSDSVSSGDGAGDDLMPLPWTSTTTHVEGTATVTQADVTTLHAVSNASWTSNTHETQEELAAPASAAATDESKRSLDRGMLLLQVDRDLSSHVFRMTPPPSDHIQLSTRSESSSGGHLDHFGNAAMDEITSVFKLLASGASVEADERSCSPFGAGHTLADDKSMVETPQDLIPVATTSGPIKSKAPLSTTKESAKATSPEVADGNHSKRSPRPSSKTASKSISSPGNARSSRSQSRPITRKSPSSQPVKRPATAANQSKAAKQRAYRQRKRARAHKDEDDNSKGKSPAKKKVRLQEPRKNTDYETPSHPQMIVGPESNQMQIVSQMVAHILDTHSSSQVLEEVSRMVEYCTTRHSRHESNFKNLPGAILDNLLEILTVDEFLGIFELYRPSRKGGSTAPVAVAKAKVDAAEADIEGTSEAEDEATVEVDPRTAKKSTSSPAQPPQTKSSTVATATTTTPAAVAAYVEPRLQLTYLPNLVESGVAYGLHLSRLIRDNQNMDLHTFLAQGGDTVLHMSLDERRSLWQYAIDRSNYGLEPENESQVHPPFDPRHHFPAQEGPSLEDLAMSLFPTSTSI